MLLPYSDTELSDFISTILSGEVGKFRIIVEVFQNPVFNFVYRIIGDREEAKDIAQETFLKVYKSLGQYDHAYKFSSWLFRIATTVSISYLRKKKPIFLPFDEGLHYDMVSPRGSPEEVCENHETSSQIQEAMLLLPSKYRLVLVLKYINEFSCQEIAKTLDTNVKNVETSLYRGRKMLAASLTQNFRNKRYKR